MHEFWVPKLFWADRNERVQKTILGPRIMLELVSQHLLDAPSRLQLGGIGVHLMHDFGVPKLFRADRNERVQTTILGHRIMLEIVLHHLLDALSRLQLRVSVCI